MARNEIPEWLRCLRIGAISELVQLSTGLQSTLGEFPTSASLAEVHEILVTRAEHFTTFVSLVDELQSAIAWLDQNGRAPIVDFLTKDLRDRAARVLQAAVRATGQESAVLPQPAVNGLRRVLNKPLIETVVQWKMNRTEATTHLSGVVELFERLAAGERVSALDETSLFLKRLPDRDRHFVVRYLELDGMPGDTLEALGMTAGVTRERVRQIVQRFIDRTSSLRPPLPICEATVEALRNAGGAVTLDGWNDQIPERIRPGSPSHLIGLRTLERWGWLPGNTWLRADGLMLVLPGQDQEEIGREFLRRMAPLLRNAMAISAASVGQLSLELQRQRCEVESLLRSSGRWEQVDSEWFVLKECGGHLLPRIAAKMLAILGPLTVDQIRSGLRRYRQSKFRQRLEVPPRPILRRVLQAGGMQVSENGDVVNLVEVPSDVTLSGGEAALVDALRDKGVLTLHEVVSAIKKRGLSAALGSYLLTSSPLISRVTYGLYALRGCRVTHAEIEVAACRLSAQSEPSLVDQQFQVDGSVLARYRLPADRDLVTFYIRPGMIPEGTWTLIDTHGREPILVRSTYVTGLQQVGRRMRKAGATEIDVRFDVGRGEVRVAEAGNGK